MRLNILCYNNAVSIAYRFIALCIIVFTTACTEAVVITEAPEIVLEKAAVAMQSQPDQGYNVLIDFLTAEATTEIQLTVRGEGALLQNGTQVSFDGNIASKGFVQGVPFTSKC